MIEKKDINSSSRFNLNSGDEGRVANPRSAQTGRRIPMEAYRVQNIASSRDMINALAIEGRNIQLDITKKREIRDVLIELLNKSEFLFIGITHTIYDTKVIVENLEILKENGLTHIALEKDSREQEALDYYASTGDYSKLDRGYVASVVCELKPIIERAKELGLTLVAFDSLAAGRHGSDRELSMCKNLNNLPKEGKKLVFTGISHTRELGIHYYSAKSLMQLTQRSISTIVLESFWSLTVLRLDNPVPPEMLVKIFPVYCSVDLNNPDWLETSFAYPTSELGNLTYLNTYEPTDPMFYKDGCDYVFVLSQEDSKVLRM